MQYDDGDFDNSELWAFFFSPPIKYVNHLTTNTNTNTVRFLLIVAHGQNRLSHMESADGKLLEKL